MNGKIVKCRFGDCFSKEEISNICYCKTNRVLNSCLCARIVSSVLHTESPAVWEVDEKHKGHCAPRPNFKNCVFVQKT